MAEFSDYDVDRPHDPSRESNSFTTFASAEYSSTARLTSPPRPSVVTSNLEQLTSNSSASGLSPDHTTSSDPHDFYRRYRESFRAREPGGIYVLNDTVEAAVASDTMPSVICPPQVSHFETKTNGLPATSVTVRLNSLATRGEQDGGFRREAKTLGAGGMSRGRQTSVKALLNKFEQGPDEILPIPSSQPGSRSTSTHKSTAASIGLRPMRTRTPSTALSDDRGVAGRRKSGTERLPFDGNGLNIRKRTSRRNSVEFRAGKQAAPAASASLMSNSSASRSMQNLAADPADTSATTVPLFGEVVAGQSEYGWGIPHPRPRRGSDGSLYRPKSLLRAGNPAELSPSSTAAWYAGTSFAADRSDLSSLQPPSERLRHKRSQSDMSGLSFAADLAVQNQPPPGKAANHFQLPPIASTAARFGIFDGMAQLQAHPGNEAGKKSFVDYMIEKQASQPPSGANEMSPGLLRGATNGHGTSLSAPQRSPRRTVLAPSISTLRVATSDETAGSAEPARSPPLRSSRTRQSMATASTAASRGKVVDRAATVGASPGRSSKPRKALPELGGVDFAARRERIQRAFSKSVEEKEAEQRRSLIIEAQRRKQQEAEAPPVPPLPSADQMSQHSSQVQAEKQLHSQQASISKLGAAGDAKDLSLDTSRITIESHFLRRESDEDSPTLGALNMLSPTEDGSSSPTDDGNRSSPHSAQISPRDELRGTITPLIGRDERNAELSSKPTGESIHIVLDDAQNSPSSVLKPSLPLESRWSMSSWASSVDSSLRNSAERADGRLESIDEAHDGPDPARSHELDQALVTDAQRSSTREPRNFRTDAREYHRTSINSIDEVVDGTSNGASFVQQAPSSMDNITRPTIGTGPSIARGSQWMVDASIIPPRSGAQVTGRSASIGNYPSDPHLEPFPNADSVPGPAPLFHTQDDNEEKQVAEGKGTQGSLSPFAALGVPSTGVVQSQQQRASLISPADFAAASPSINDWIAVQAQDTPSEERVPYLQGGRSEKAQTKRPTGLRRPSTPKKSISPRLPEIQRTTEPGLGIVDVEVNEADSKNQGLSHIPELPMISRNHAENGELDHSTLASSPVRPANSPSRAGLLSKYNKAPTIAFEEQDMKEESPYVQPSLDSEARNEPSILSATQNEEHGQQRKSLSGEEQKRRDAEQRRLTRRKNIIKELVDTESSFGQDMTVVVDIYKETSHVILQNSEDVRVLFGNASEIVQFSTQFLDSLKAAAHSVYRLPKSKRWRTKRDSSATADSSIADESSLSGHTDLSEDERDRLSTIGQAFEQNLSHMEKVYTDYLKNHEAACAKLQQLQKSDKVQIWLNECRSYASDLTTAWDLDSLLVKPVQRILKYPLLLKELAEVTPENHPDFILLDNASRESVGVNMRINAAKKRADLVEQANSHKDKDKKKSRDESRNAFAIAKAFGRSKEKVKQQVGLSDVAQDKTYNILADKFGSHFFQVQVVMRDVEMYTVDVQKWVSNFENFIVSIEQYMDVSQTVYPEVESKWRMFRNSVREIQVTALTDHVNAIRKHVIEPMTTLLKLYEGPQRMMEKRKKRIYDHMKWQTLQDAGGKVDRKVVEHGEQFVALNDTLKEELPKLFGATKTLIEACLNNFVQLQLQWQIIWRRKLSAAVDMRKPPRDVRDILDAFTSDFKYTEEQVMSMSLCNGALLTDDTINLDHTATGLSSSATTLNGDESSSRQTSLTFDDAREARQQAVQTVSSRNRAPSANSQSAFTNQTVPYFPAAYAQGPSTRNRTASNASGRTSEQQSWIHSTNFSSVTSPKSSNPSGRPSSHVTRTQSGPQGQSSYDPSSYIRYSDESSRRHQPWYQGLYGTRSTEPQYGIGAALAGAAGTASATANPRGSTVFSSALPPSDTSYATPVSHSSNSQTTQTFDPNADHERYADTSQPQFNVLFLAASVYEFNIDRARREAGYPYLTYSAGEIFDVIGEKGELWLAKNQDDTSNTLGWIWNKHFAKLATEL